MKKSLLFLSLIVASCSNDVVLNKNFIVVDVVQQNSDGTFEISLRKSTGVQPVHFNSKFRLQAGDTLWSRYQLKEYNIDKFASIGMENAMLKDSINVLRTKLKNFELENMLLKNYYTHH